MWHTTDPALKAAIAEGDPTPGAGEWANLPVTFPYLGRLVRRIRRLRDGSFVQYEPTDCPDDLESAIMPADALGDPPDDRITPDRAGITDVGSERVF